MSAMAVSISRAHVLAAVDRRNREVAALGGGAVAEIAAFVCGTPLVRRPSVESISSRASCVRTVKRTSSKMKNSASGPNIAVSPMPVDFR
jgi:hypothetical protein